MLIGFIQAILEGGNFAILGLHLSNRLLSGCLGCLSSCGGLLFFDCEPLLGILDLALQRCGLGTSKRSGAAHAGALGASGIGDLTTQLDEVSRPLFARVVPVALSFREVVYLSRAVGNSSWGVSSQN